MRESIASKLSQQALLQPLERMETIGSSKKNLSIGIPKETSYQEKRISITPLSAGLLIQNGHHVVMETNAGIASNFSDVEYSEVGVQIVYEAKQVYESDIIIKVAPPTEDELEWLKPNQTLISALHLASVDKQYIQKLCAKKVTALCYEYLKDEGGIYTVVRSMGEIVGSTSILIAAEYLSNVNQGKGLMFGGISGVPPTEIVIIGAGTVAEYAAKTALGLGAQVQVFDNSVYKLRRLQNNIGSRIFTSVIQPVVLQKALRKCDVAIGALRAEEGRSPCVVSEEMVASMKPKAVIIDVSIDQGGCFETSEVTNHSQPSFVKNEIIHYCVPNIASRVSRTASYALTNIFTPILIDIGEAGGIHRMLWNNRGVRSGVFIYKGELTNKHLAKRFNTPYKDLDFLVSAQF
jgi:alanine dehydrogenase